MKAKPMLATLFSRHYWQAILLLTQVSVTKLNRHTFLGSAWSLLQPFIHIVVISFFFSFLLRQEPEVIVKNLVGALPLWGFLNNALTVACDSLISKGAILKRQRIPKTYFPIAEVLNQVYTLQFAFFAMYAGMILFYPHLFSLNILLAPLLALPLIITTMAGGVACAFLTPYVRDIPPAITVGLSVLYWTVPIIYPFSMIPESKRYLFDLHPIYVLIKPVQDLVIHSAIPSAIVIAKSWLVSGLLSLVCYFIYSKLTKRVIYYL